MSLKNKLQQIKTASRERISPEIAAVMARSTAELEQSGILEMALRKGQQTPEFELPDTEGNLYKSKDLLDQGPLVLNFYRGAW